MFGASREVKATKQLSGIIAGCLEAFERALAVTARANNKKMPPYGDAYLAILLGFVDAAGQAGNVEMGTTRNALKAYLCESSDGLEVFQRMMALSNDRRYFEGQMLGGRAVTTDLNSGDKVAPMLSLAEAYLS